MNSTSKKHIYIAKFINLVLSVFMLFTCINFTSIKATNEVTGTKDTSIGEVIENSEETAETDSEQTKGDESEANDSYDNQNDGEYSTSLTTLSDELQSVEVSNNNSNDTEVATIIYHKVVDGVVGSEQGGISLSSYRETLSSSESDATGSTASIATGMNWYQFDGWYDNENCEGEALSTDSAYTPSKPNDGWAMGNTYTYYAKFSYVSSYLKRITINAYWIGDQGKTDATPLLSKTTTDSYKIGGRNVNVNAYDYLGDNLFGYQLISNSTSSTVNVTIQSDDSLNVANFYIYRKYVVLEANKPADVLYDGTEKTVNAGYISYLPTDSTKTNLGLVFRGVTASGSGTAIGKYDVTFSKEDGGEIEYTAIDTTGNYVVNKAKNSSFNIVESLPDFRFEYEDYDCSYSYTGRSISGIPVVTTVENGTTIKFRSSTDDGKTWTSWTTEQPSRTEVGTTKVQAKATNPNYQDSLETEYTLTVTPEDISAVGSFVSVHEIEDYNSYDGNEHKLEPEVTDRRDIVTIVKNTDYTLSYSDDVTSAGEVTVTVTGIGNYTGTKSTTYGINPRPVTLVSGSSEKEYDGTALTNSTVNYAQDSLEFVTGEYPDIEITGTITDVVKDDKGNDTSVPNTFVVKESEDSNYIASNYAITKQEGTLKVTHIGTNITVYIQGNTDTYEYDGEYHGISGYKVTEVEGAKKDLYDVTKNIEFTGDLKAKTYKDVNTQADGYPGSIYVADFKNISNNFSNVTFIVNQGTVTITPRTYTIKTESATKSYDGKALTASGKVVGLVDGDTATFTITGSQTEVGSSKNTYEDFAFTGDTKASNYVHGEDSIGTLTVTEKSSKKSSGGWDDGGPFTTDTCGNVFDRWGNKIYEAKGCNVGGYNLVSTSVED